MADDCGSLVQRTKELLRNSEKTYLQIYTETGITPHWLSFFANDKFENSSANRIQKLYECLAGKELQV